MIENMIQYVLPSYPEQAKDKYISKWVHIYIVCFQ